MRTNDNVTEEFDDQISFSRKSFDGVEFHKVLCSHYATLITPRSFGCYFFHFFISNTLTFRLSGSLSRSFVPRACIIVSLCRTSQIKRCHSWEIKDEESSAGKNYCLSSFSPSHRLVRSLCSCCVLCLSPFLPLPPPSSLSLSLVARLRFHCSVTLRDLTVLPPTPDTNTAGRAMVSS